MRVYESFHGGSRESVGPERANPLPLLLPAIDLLDGVGDKAAARRVETAVGRVLTERRALTPDLGGTATTMEMADAIVAALRRRRSAKGKETTAARQAPWPPGRIHVRLSDASRRPGPDFTGPRG